MPDDPVRLTIRIEGRVQGVGFRFTAASLAEHRAVTGYVQNEHDGSVLLVLEGQRDDLASLFEALRRTPAFRGVTAEQPRWSCATGEFARFDIRR